MWSDYWLEFFSLHELISFMSKMGFRISSPKVAKSDVTSQGHKRCGKGRRLHRFLLCVLAVILVVLGGVGARHLLQVLGGGVAGGGRP